MQKVKTKKAKVVLSLLLSVMMLFSVIAVGTTSVSAATPTGIGLSAYALKAYNEGWAYVWGGMSPGAVDCSGLFKCYDNSIGGVRTDMLYSSQQAGLDWGYVSNGIPRVHGLGLHKPGHVGVYVGSDRAIDARGTNWGIIDSSVWSVNWVEWYKVVNVSYPTNGWVRFDGDSFYYESGQYIVNTSRTIDGVKYTFNSAGKSDKHPPESSYEQTDYSSGGSSSNGGSSSGGSSSNSSNYLKVGSQGSKVEELQKKLKKLGYFEDDVTGYFGTYTAACVKEFQTDAKIEVDGVVGPEFWETINGNNPPKKKTADNNNASSTTNEDNNSSTDNSPEEDTYVEPTQPQETEDVVAEEATEPVVDVTEPVTEPVTEETTETPTTATEPVTEAPTTTTQAPTEPPTEPDGTLRYGDSGQPIKNLQTRLTDLGFYFGEITGVFDDNTLNALYDYFAASELRGANEITEEQLDVLYSSLAAKAPVAEAVTVDDKGEEVTEIQKDLVKLGYLDSITGTYDTDTRSAVKVAQANFVMEVTGEATEEFRNALSMEVIRQDSQVVKNAAVKTNAEVKGALTPAEVAPINVVSNENTDNGSTILMGLAGIMFVLAASGTVVYAKHRKTRNTK